MGSVLFATLFVALQFATGLANPDSKRLYDDLLSNYNRLIRPVGNNSDRLTVKMGLRLSQLIDVVSNPTDTDCLAHRWTDRVTPAILCIHLNPFNSNHHLSSPRCTPSIQSPCQSRIPSVSPGCLNLCHSV